MKTLLAAVLVAMPLTLADVPAATPPEADSPLAALRTLALDRSGGDLTRLGVMVTYGPEGPIERPITGEEFLALAADVFLRAPGGADADHFVVPEAVGAGINQPQLAQRLGWPFCDNVSIFVQYIGPAGSAFTHVIFADGPTIGVGTGPICGGFYGPTRLIADATIDAAGLGTILYGPCGAAMVMVPPTAHIGLLGGYNCGWDVGCFSGSAVMTSLNFFGIAIDYIIGSTGTIAMGSAGVDIERCVPGLVPGIPRPL